MSCIPDSAAAPHMVSYNERKLLVPTYQRGIWLSKEILCAGVTYLANLSPPRRICLGNAARGQGLISDHRLTWVFRSFLPAIRNSSVNFLESKSFLCLSPNVKIFVLSGLESPCFK